MVLKKQAQTLAQQTVTEFRTVTATMVRELAGVQEQMKDMSDRYRKEVVVRKKLHNQIIEMKVCFPWLRRISLCVMGERNECELACC